MHQNETLRSMFIGKPKQKTTPNMRSRVQSGRVERFLTKWWGRLVVDECPDARRERIRRERIDKIMLDVVTLEAMRLWEIEHRKSASNLTRSRHR